MSWHTTTARIACVHVIVACACACPSWLIERRLPPSPQVRASNLHDYRQANLEISRESRVTVYEKAEGSEGTLAKEGNFVHKSRDKDSTLGEGVEVCESSLALLYCMLTHICTHKRIRAALRLADAQPSRSRALDRIAASAPASS